MRSFSEVRFEEPGYPIVKAFVVPYRDGDRVVSTRRVTPRDVEIWRDVLRKLKEFISESVKFAKENRSLTEAEELELISDLMALFFKIPLLREPLPATSPSPLKLYLLCRLLGFQVIEDKISKPLELAESIYDKNITKTLRELKPVAILSDMDLSEKIEHCWFVFPADTRPSFNTSGLLPHLLLTSALVWGRATIEGFTREEAAILRLSAMLHDIGKPFRYADHVAASLEVAEILLEGSSYLDKIKKFISEHHVWRETREARILSSMDGAAASIDRLTALSEKIIGEDIRDLSSKAGLDSSEAYVSGPRGWRFWREVYSRDESSIENLSRKFVEKLSEEMENYTKPIEGMGGEPIEGIEMGLIDVGEIQSFVFRSEELRIVTAASLVIDTLVMLQLPLRIQHVLLHKRGVWFPYEAILYSAGGVVELILPRDLVSLVRGICKEVGEVPVRFASVPLSTNYGEVMQNLAKKIQEEKFRMGTEEHPIRASAVKGVRNLCELCYLSPPSRKIRTPEGEKSVCDKCGKLYEIGHDLHFRAKYESEVIMGGITPGRAFGMDWEEAGKWIMEIVSGHDRRELAEGYRLRNLGVVKVDGNLVGPFMGTCVSPTDAYERSARVDLALKKAIEHSVKALFQGVLMASGGAQEEAAKAASSVKLGILYAGGDDGVFFMPSWCALPFAMVLQREFLINLGNARGLAAGVVASPARSSVWAIISAASKLVEKAKAEARENPSLNVLCFDVVESGTLSDSSAEARLEALRELFLSSQPYRAEDLEDLLKIVVDGYSSDADAFGKCFVLSRFPKLCDGELRGRTEAGQRRVKQIRSAINSSLAVARSHVESSEYVPIAAFFYAKRQEARMGEHTPYSDVLKLIPESLGKRSRLADADRLIKMVGGGVL